VTATAGADEDSTSGRTGRREHNQCGIQAADMSSVLKIFQRLSFLKDLTIIIYMMPSIENIRNVYI
jgi:hypothetical protein